MNCPEVQTNRFCIKIIVVKKKKRRKENVKKISKVIYAIMGAKSPKISQIAQKLPLSKSFKINQEELPSSFFNQNSEFVIVDPTEIEKNTLKIHPM